MKEKNVTNRKNVVLFKRWQNKGYSILSTIGKIVIILTLPFAYLMMSFNFAYSQTDTVDILGVVINSQRKTVFSNQNSKLINIISKEQIKKLPVNNLTDLLDGTLGVDLQQRGAGNVQADISIRGGNFEQTLILLNGIPVSDPQTGHNSFSFPIPLENIDRVEVLQGPGTRLYGLGAYSGAINIVTKTADKKQVMLNTEIGNFGQFNANVYVGVPLGKNFKLAYSGLYGSSEGYITNTDYNFIGQFLSFIYEKNNLSIVSQISYNNKKYGAYNFYTPKFPYQYEIIGKLRAASNINFGKNKKNKVNIYYNMGTDIFQLFRENQDWYKHVGNYWIKNDADTAKYAKGVYKDWAYYPGHNYHRTQTLGGAYSSYLQTIAGVTNYGVSLEQNKIISTVLGEDIKPIVWNETEYSKGETRTNYNVFVEHNIKINKINISAGVNFIYNKKFGFHTTWGGDINFMLNNKNRFYSSVNQGIRMPTFTDLYYSGPVNSGNENLVPEKAVTYEIGYKYFSKNIQIQSAVFYRNGKNTIDWVKFKQSEKWQTMNYTKINTKGVELSVNKKINSRFINFFNINYVYLFQNKPQEDIISKYTLNYLRHNLLFSANHEIVKNLNFNWRAKYNFRNGTYFYLNDVNFIVENDFGGTWLLDAKLSYTLKYFTIYIQVSNIFDEKYYDISYIELPGRQMLMGLKFRI